MKFIKEYKIKSGTWGYMVNQKGEYLTEYCQSAKGFSNYNGDIWTPKLGINAVLEGAIEIGDVSRGRSAAGCYVNDDTQRFYMSVGNVVKALQMVAEGKLMAKDGKIQGLWTFAKQGDTISLTPYEGI